MIRADRRHLRLIQRAFAIRNKFIEQHSLPPGVALKYEPRKHNQDQWLATRHLVMHRMNSREARSFVFSFPADCSGDDDQFERALWGAPTQAAEWANART